MKLIHFSSQSILSKYNELSDLKNQIEVFDNQQNLSAEQILQQGFDIIELGSGEFSAFRPSLHTLDLKTSRFGVADVILKLGRDYRPMHLLAESVYKAILAKVPDLKTSESAVIIGDYDFVLAVTNKLAQAGFFKMIIATDKIADSEKIKNLVQLYVFNIQISIIPMNELTQLESGSVLLISNLTKKQNPEAYESITYFNFLSRGAAFVDLNSRNEPILAEEARRAEIIVIHEIEILRIKYQAILELFKNSPFV
ncbi:MAG: hypothetical protein A2622_01230 [Bdellovibrionales bacterium RIFCSPHIGHO2_01_FULL_40_29]|nr:MAG: hypothetical protein A2622_01230 [Bdellovibrionales bacterium RIFCSPHIGHO2_01_FULL_40_29]OFZ32735.1 MAG: hypothetical protein A3D17_05830 [Bdellovibrionales bacterium RIFCSPHIGHO2_02_FULL_40_15]